MLDKIYTPKEIEKKWSEAWRKAELFRSQPEGDPHNRYVIVIPPPNVTGALHIGHALDNTLQDILIRHHRLIGRQTCWVPGTDHGGIATQNVMEKQLKAENKTRRELGREEFLKRMWDWVSQCKKTILDQLERLGCALDLERYAFTMDETRARAVSHAFQALWETKGEEGRHLIYRGDRMINWCVHCTTALSDIEVEHEERKGKLWHIRYPLKGASNKEGLVVATTRPETLLGDTAVAVHPEDERYKGLIRKTLLLPLENREIPIVGDDQVDPAFGSGAVKVTPNHDENDFKLWQRHWERPDRFHRLAYHTIGYDGKITQHHPQYAGLSREKAREKVIADLQAAGLLEKTEEHAHSVGICYRCQQVIEPMLSEQWFMRMEPFAKKALSALQQGDFRIFPDPWAKPYAQWLENIQDWCLSRQIWWGHRLPVWYCVNCCGEHVQGVVPDPAGKRVTGSARELRDRFGLKHLETHGFYNYALGPEAVETGAVLDARNAKGIQVRGEKPGPCDLCGGKDWLQDQDVLDTWFSSALWPFSVFGWPEDPDLKFYYPTTVLVTGYEILYLWVARMQMLGLHFSPEFVRDKKPTPPFAHALIHGIVRDKRGKKMSKSLGNVVDPLVMMDKYGTDAFRFSLVLQAHPGKDIPFDEESITGPRNFANKLWNSARFVLMNMPAETGKVGRGSELGWELADYWIVWEFNRMRMEVDSRIKGYELAAAADAIYGFLWDTFCDWYIELAKIRLSGPKEEGKKAAQEVLAAVLTNTMKLLHPFMPYITEELYQALKPYAGENARFLLEAQLPALRGSAEYAMDPAPMRTVMEIVTALRGLRSQLNVPPGLKIRALYAAADHPSAKPSHRTYLMSLARLSALEPTASGRPPNSATTVAGGWTFYLPLEGLIDFNKEKKRITKEVERLQSELQHCEIQLSNPAFLSHAPSSEVEKIRLRREQAEKAHAILSDTLHHLN